jgi:hypothetical protein
MCCQEAQVSGAGRVDGLASGRSRAVSGASGMMSGWLRLHLCRGAMALRRMPDGATCIVPQQCRVSKAVQREGKHEQHALQRPCHYTCKVIWCLGGSDRYQTGQDHHKGQSKGCCMPCSWDRPSMAVDALWCSPAPAHAYAGMRCQPCPLQGQSRIGPYQALMACAPAGSPACRPNFICLSTYSFCTAHVQGVSAYMTLSASTLVV